MDAKNSRVVLKLMHFIQSLQSGTRNSHVKVLTHGYRSTPSGGYSFSVTRNTGSTSLTTTNAFKANSTRKKSVVVKIREFAVFNPDSL